MKRYVILVPFLAIQGPIATIVASFMSSPGGGSKLSVGIVYVLVVFVDMLTDTVAYLVGKHAKEWLVARHPKRISLAPRSLAVVEEYFRKEGLQTMIVAKLGYGIGLPTMLAAGSAKVSYKRFMAINASVSIFKSAALVALGYYYGQYYRQIIHLLGKVGIILTALLAVFVAYFILKKLRRKR